MTGLAPGVYCAYCYYPRTYPARHYYYAAVNYYSPPSMTEIGGAVQQRWPAMDLSRRARPPARPAAFMKRIRVIRRLLGIRRGGRGVLGAANRIPCSQISDLRVGPDYLNASTGPD
jgi:hypothetical protein